jgi:hypothetical protein
MSIANSPEPPDKEWDSPYRLHSNASETRGSAGAVPLQKRRVNQFKYRLSAISMDGGKTILKLYEDPMIEVDHDNLTCKVLHWETQLPLTNVEDIARTLGRRFLELYSKAIDERLTEQEEAHWLEIVQRVDYQSFCNDRTPARYVEGVVKSTGTECTVEWHDGEVESLHPQAARTLNILNAGDRFGGWIKWGRDHKTQQIEELKIL